ncbi:MAG: hypothetical protein WBN04_19365 [Paracoccaceae bacterium]
MIKSISQILERSRDKSKRQGIRSKRKNRAMPDSWFASEGCDFPLWATPTTLIQRDDQDLSELIAEFPRKDAEDRQSPKLVHMVNLYPPRPDDTVQACTTTSMLDAQHGQDGRVKLVNVQLQSDPDQTPAGFVRSPDIERTIASVDDNLSGRPLPLLFDILESGAQAADPDDFLIYTNADICVQPYFYECVFDLVSRGFDAVIVNRRTIGADFIADHDTPLLHADLGKRHKGYDCFVFRKEAFDRYARNNACIGAASVAMGLLYNMVVHSSKMLILTDVAMTYHFGDDQPWQSGNFADYTSHNRREYLSTLRTLSADEEAREKLEQFVTAWRNPRPSRRLVAELKSNRML